MMTHEHPVASTPEHRALLAARNIRKPERAALGELWQEFQAAFRGHVRGADRDWSALTGAFRFCARMMLDLDCSYLGCTWDQILAWRDECKLRTWDQFTPIQRRV